ncbi:ferredoxin family protein [uncultured Mailhella sp.]|uniref:4Fe-4S dicluster domain-containing protein n=1 Tax=uncultured Mailhella sp. TaxID=1981031 RepID=UPI0025D631E4|nr:4Fe-4S binding protein [uncultured Mailhella sp.]
MPPVIDPQKCVGCGTCADICNSDIFVFDRATDAIPRIKYPDECWHCNSCVMDCPHHAVRLNIPLSFMLLHVNADTLGQEVER